MAKIHGRVNREDFHCEKCGRLVDTKEQYEFRYRQTRFCKEHYAEWKKEQERERVKKYYREKGSV